MRRARGHQDLDEIDRSLTDLLALDPRTSNRALAAAVGLTDETVATRLRRLREAGLLATTVLVDWEAAGYLASAFVRMELDGAAGPEALEQLAKVPEIASVTRTMGACDAFALVLGRDLASLQRVVAEEVRGLPGVARAGVDLITDVHVVSAAITTLPIADWSPSELPEPVVELDELDHRLLRALATDGHQSRGELARRLGVSDGTVRARTRRLEESGLIRITAARDPVASGDLASVALVWLTVGGGDPARLVETLAEHPDVAMCASCLGCADLVLLVTTASEEHLAEVLVHELPALPAVRHVRTAIAVEVLLHRSHLTRLL